MRILLLGAAPMLFAILMTLMIFGVAFWVNGSRLPKFSLKRRQIKPNLFYKSKNDGLIYFKSANDFYRFLEENVDDVADMRIRNPNGQYEHVEDVLLYGSNFIDAG